MGLFWYTNFWVPNPPFPPPLIPPPPRSTNLVPPPPPPTRPPQVSERLTTGGGICPRWWQCPDPFPLPHAPPPPPCSVVVQSCGAGSPTAHCPAWRGRALEDTAAPLRTAAVLAQGAEGGYPNRQNGGRCAPEFRGAKAAEHATSRFESHRHGCHVPRFAGVCVSRTSTGLSTHVVGVQPLFCPPPPPAQADSLIQNGGRRAPEFRGTKAAEHATSPVDDRLCGGNGRRYRRPFGHKRRSAVPVLEQPPVSLAQVGDWQSTAPGRPHNNCTGPGPGQGPRPGPGPRAAGNPPLPPHRCRYARVEGPSAGTKHPPEGWCRPLGHLGEGRPTATAEARGAQGHLRQTSAVPVCSEEGVCLGGVGGMRVSE